MVVPRAASAAVPAQPRRNRSPQHKFIGRTYPWAIQPVSIVPVLPGDTLESASLQARVVTDPLDSKLLGWWQEFHLFYVKWRDTALSEELQTMALNPYTATGIPTVTGSAGPTYRMHGRPDFTAAALNAVVDWWFRDEGQDHTDHVHGLVDLPLAKLGVQDWTASLADPAQFTAVDVNVDLNTSGTIFASEVETAMRQWELLRQGEFTDMSFEDWLATYGVRTQRAEVLRPELLGSERAWSYPSNTVTQGTGAVTSACTWSIQKRWTKGRFFTEPGWLLLVSVTKPKYYSARRLGGAVNLLDNALSWLPAVLSDDPATSLITATSVTGGLSSVVGGSYAADIKDLYLYGDQFIFCAPSVGGGAGSVAAGAAIYDSVPTSEKNKLGLVQSSLSNYEFMQFPAGNLTELQSLFVSSVAEGCKVEMDGIFSPTIRGTLLDTTPGTPRR